MKLWELYQEEKSSTVSHNDREYSINKLLDYAEDLEVEEYKVDDLKWILEYEHLHARNTKPNLKYPILVTRSGGVGKLVVLDGIHRLKKAVEEKDKTIKGKYITKEILEKSLVE